MTYQVTGQHADGAALATSVESAKTALIIARQWQREGIVRITITNPEASRSTLTSSGGSPARNRMTTNNHDAEVGFIARDLEASVVEAPACAGRISSRNSPSA
jgi:hypothetical protein